MHQKIRPKTSAPTTSAATTAPIHRSYIRLDCSVMPLGQPRPNTSSAEQPESSTVAANAVALSPTHRPIRRERTSLPCATTCSCLPRKRPERWQTTRPICSLLWWGDPKPIYPVRSAGYRYRVAFFDAAAGAPLHPVAAQALLAAQQDGWADPTKLYAPARRARQLLDAARESVAESLSTAASQPVRADEVRFLPSGTAAAHAAVAGARLARESTRPARESTGAIVVHSAIEHSAVLYAA